MLDNIIKYEKVINFNNDCAAVFFGSMQIRFRT